MSEIIKDGQAAYAVGKLGAVSSASDTYVRASARMDEIERRILAIEAAAADIFSNGESIPASSRAAAAAPEGAAWNLLAGRPPTVDELAAMTRRIGDMPLPLEAQERLGHLYVAIMALKSDSTRLP